MRLLCLSNGHGEDTIALKILTALQRRSPDWEIAALPIVGEGHAYQRQGIPLIGPRQTMPSGGFIYMDAKEFWGDLKGGLLGLTWAQFQAIRQWIAQDPAHSRILAVGDIVPLIFAWLVGVPHAFVGTAKSDYYWRDESGPLDSTDRLTRWFGCDYAPWERWLMGRKQCRAVFPRDGLTAANLQRRGLRAFDLGNPMMDGAETASPQPREENDRTLHLLLLPGSRLPEAQRNWHMMLRGLRALIQGFGDRPLLFMAALAPSVDRLTFTQPLFDEGWLPLSRDQYPLPFPDARAEFFQSKQAILILSSGAYWHCLHQAEAAIAMAGTATEQFVGLGKPVFSFPGEGPQFTAAFAEAQTRLLGCSVLVLKQPYDLPQAITAYLHNPERMRIIQDNGWRRMGDPGAGDRIAAAIVEHLG